MTIDMLVLWIHLVCMLGALGGLFVIAVGLPRDARESTYVAGVAGRPVSMLLTIGFIAGLALYGLHFRYAANMDTELPRLEHIVVGTKFLLLLAAGAFMGATGKALKRGALGRASGSRWMAILALAAAALIGVML